MKRVFFSLMLMLVASAVCSAQTFYFPQVAVGGFGNGSWVTTIFVSNARADTASGTITLTKSDGGPFNSTWVDEAGRSVSNGNQIPFQLGPSESRKFMSIPDIGLTTGYATVSSNSLGVLGNAMFTQLGPAGNMVSEAGVPMGIPLGKQAVFVDTTSGFKTGVAIANPNSNALHINFELVNDTGQIVLRTSRDLSGYQHTSFFVHELFPDAPTMVGRLQFYCVNPMVSVALRFEPSFTVFTTMPPIAVAP
jgi:hypothetical protein